MKYKMQALADNEKVPSLFIQKRRTKEITFFFLEGGGARKNNLECLQEIH
jgi:hypothetical protein